MRLLVWRICQHRYAGRPAEGGRVSEPGRRLGPQLANQDRDEPLVEFKREVADRVSVAAIAGMVAPLPGRAAAIMRVMVSPVAVAVQTDASAEAADMSADAHAFAADVGAGPNAADVGVKSNTVRACRAGSEQSESENRSNERFHGEFLG